MYRRSTILCDMDGILVDLNRDWLAALERDHGVKVTVGQLLFWDLLKCEPLKHLKPKDVYGYLEQPGFFLNASPLPGAIEGLKALVADGHRVVILSSAGYPGVAAEKREWLLKWCPFLPKTAVIIVGEMSQKMMVDGDYIIDDNPEVLNDWCGHGHVRPSVAFGIQYPFNEFVVNWNNYDRLKTGSYLDTGAAWEKIVRFIRSETAVGG